MKNEALHFVKDVLMENDAYSRLDMILISIDDSHFFYFDSTAIGFSISTTVMRQVEDGYDTNDFYVNGVVSNGRIKIGDMTTKAWTEPEGDAGELIYVHHDKDFNANLYKKGWKDTGAHL